MKRKLSSEVLLVVAGDGVVCRRPLLCRPDRAGGLGLRDDLEADLPVSDRRGPEGRVPLWNPYVHLGRPYLADMPNMTFYPPLYLICLGQRTGVFLLVWLHCLLGAFGMRRLAGALGAGRWQSYFMAICFLASGPLMAHWVTGQLPYCWAICYMPWLFYCAVRTEEPWQSRRIALHAVLLALQLLCIPQVFWFSAVGQAVFIVARALRLPVRAGGSSTRGAASASLAWRVSGAPACWPSCCCRFSS